MGSGLGGHRFGDSASWSSGVGEDQEGIENLTWEKGLKRDIGLEIKLFNSLLSFDFDYFFERRWDILIQRNTVPGIAGLNKLPLANMGVLNNQGFEFTGELNHHIGKVGYRLYGNFSFARNKVIEKTRRLLTAGADVQGTASTKGSDMWLSAISPTRTI